jgi:hypothetical protein
MRGTITRIWIRRWETIRIRMSRLGRLAHIGWRTRVVVIGCVSRILARRLVASFNLVQSKKQNIPDTEDAEEGSVLVEDDAMLTEEGIGLAVLDRSGIVKAPWDHLNMELVWEDHVCYNHSGHHQVVELVSLEMDNSLPAADRSEEDMRPDVLLLPSFCSFVQEILDTS